VADKNFVVKNGLVVGSTATINGVIIDPSGASDGQVLTYSSASGKFISGTTVPSETVLDGGTPTTLQFFVMGAVDAGVLT